MVSKDSIEGYMRQRKKKSIHGNHLNFKVVYYHNKFNRFLSQHIVAMLNLTFLTMTHSSHAESDGFDHVTFQP
jgi:hypothetical protein